MEISECTHVEEKEWLLTYILVNAKHACCSADILGAWHTGLQLAKIGQLKLYIALLFPREDNAKQRDAEAVMTH